MYILERINTEVVRLNLHIKCELQNALHQHYETTTMDYKSTFFMLNKLAKSHEHTVA